MARSSLIELEFKNERHWKSVESDQRFHSLLKVTYHGTLQEANVKSCLLNNGRVVVTITFNNGATVYVSKFINLCSLFIIRLLHPEHWQSEDIMSFKALKGFDSPAKPESIKIGEEEIPFPQNMEIDSDPPSTNVSADAQLYEKISDLERQLVQVNKENNELKDTVIYLKEKAEKAETENKTLSAEVKNLKNFMEQFSHAMKSYTEAETTIKEKNRKLNSHINVYEKILKAHGINPIDTLYDLDV